MYTYNLVINGYSETDTVHMYSWVIYAAPALIKTAYNTDLKILS